MGTGQQKKRATVALYYIFSGAANQSWNPTKPRSASLDWTNKAVAGQVQRRDKLIHVDRMSDAVFVKSVLTLMDHIA